MPKPKTLSKKTNPPAVCGLFGLTNPPFEDTDFIKKKNRHERTNMEEEKLDDQDKGGVQHTADTLTAYSSIYMEMNPCASLDFNECRVLIVLLAASAIKKCAK